MSWSSSWLLLFASSLLVGLSDGQGICGDEIKNVTVREFITSLFDRMVGDWVVTYYWENQNKSYFPDTECVYYKQELNPKPNLLNLTQIQRYDNGTRTETPQLLKFKDSNYVDYYLKRDDPNAQVLEKRLLDYDLTAPEKKDRYIIVYACNQDGSNQPWKRFWTLTNRTDTYEESPAVNLATDQALGRVGLNRGLIKSLWNEDCAQQEWGEKSLPFAKTAPSTLESPTGTPISTTEEPKVSE